MQYVDEPDNLLRRTACSANASIRALKVWVG